VTSNVTCMLGGLTLRIGEVSWNSDDSVVDSSSEVSLSSLSHLDQDHRRDFFWCELLVLSLELNLDNWLSGTVDDLEWEVLHIGLNLRICELATNQTLRIEDSVDWVHGDLVLGGISDQTLGICESDEGRSGTVSLVVGDNFDSVITENTNTRVGSSQIDTNTVREVSTCVCCD